MSFAIWNAAILLMAGIAARMAYVRGYANGWDCAVHCMRDMRDK